MELLENYKKGLSALYEHVGFKEDWVVYPIDDCTKNYWKEDGEEVTYHETEEGVENSEEGNCYVDEIYTQRFYDKHVYRGKDLTMIFCDPGVDGMKWFRVFDNSKELK